MKHKAQESLDVLSYPLDDSSCGGCKCGTSDCRDCKKAIAVFNVEDLINCQLTPDEATAIFTVAGNFATVFSTLKDSGIFNEKSIEVIKSIAKDLDSGLNKLQKQKEMWVSEDETN